MSGAPFIFIKFWMAYIYLPTQFSTPLMWRHCIVQFPIPWVWQPSITPCLNEQRMNGPTVTSLSNLWNLSSITIFSLWWLPLPPGAWGGGGDVLCSIVCQLVPGGVETCSCWMNRWRCTLITSSCGTGTSTTCSWYGMDLLGCYPPTWRDSTGTN